MVTIVEQLKERLSVSYGPVCRALDVPYSSLMRWKGRRGSGQAVVRRPGPAKVAPLDLDALHDEIRQLDHGRQRTRGTGALYDRHRQAISRRDLHRLVEGVRRELQQERDALLRRVEWLVPGLVWSMDDAKRHWLRECFGHVHLVVDLGSRYNLRALGDDEQANGWRVALNLEELFRRHGPPLFLKMDGGGNFRHGEVRRLLGRYGVIPLLSPPYYPPYNGSVERGHQQLLGQLDARIGTGKISAYQLRLESEVSAHELNHKPRVSLAGRTACAALEAGRGLVRVFNRRKRREVFDQIRALTVDITESLQEHTPAASETAFRYAAETWMQENHIIRVTQNKEVLPPFYQIQSH